MSSRVTTCTKGTNSVETESYDLNNFNTDILTAGVVGTITNATPDTGSFAVQAQGSPDKTVSVQLGTAYVTATPNGGVEQLFRVSLSADTNVTCASNSTGSTVYDKILIVLQEDQLVNPPASNDWSSLTGTDALLQVERHTAAGEAIVASNAYELAEITLANNYSTITDAVITDSRENISTTALQIQEVEAAKTGVPFATTQNQNVTSPTVNTQYDITNLTKVITTTGRVLIMFAITYTTSENDDLVFTIVRDSTEVQQFRAASNGSFRTITGIWVDNPGAGTYTYKMQFGTITVGTTNMKTHQPYSFYLISL